MRSKWAVWPLALVAAMLMVGMATTAVSAQGEDKRPIATAAAGLLLGDGAVAGGVGADGDGGGGVRGRVRDVPDEAGGGGAERPGSPGWCWRRRTAG